LGVLSSSVLRNSWDWELGSETFAECQFKLQEMDEDGGQEPEDEEMEEQKPNGALDPRAGQVDVVLPQLDIDYAALIDMLTAAASRENTKGRNKKIIFSLVRQ